MGIGGESQGQGQKQKDNKPMKLGGIGIDMSMVKDPVTMLTE